MTRSSLAGALCGVAVWWCASGAPPAAAHTASTPSTATPAQALAAHHVTVVSAAGVEVSEAVLAELWEGLRSLPEPLRQIPGGPLTFELRPEASPFGMGDGSAARPGWLGGRDRFLLYAYEEPREPRAAYRLEALSAQDRERLWRRRAMVHAVLQRWDDRYRWSGREEWKRLTGWVEAGDNLLAFTDHGRNEYEWAYSRRRGQQSAALDLVTFAEEALAPAESLDPGAVPIDDQLRCQEFSKTRYLAERLEALGARAQALSTPSSECPAFARWADLAHLSHIEVLLSAPSGQRLQSLFGHLMIRPAFENAAGETRATDPVMEVAAITGFDEHPLRLLAFGAVGGYLNAFEELSVPMIRGEHVDRDGRNVRRFVLELTEEQEVRVMERLWEAQRRGYYPYRFFSDNCASYVAFLLGGAAPPERVASPAGPIVLPTGVLDLLPAKREPGALLSHRTIAAWAEREQDALIDALAARAPAEAREWRETAAAAKSAVPSARYAAYRRFEPLAHRTVANARAPGAAELVLGIVEAAVRMERYAAQSAQAEAMAVDLRRIVLPPGTHLPTTEELLAERQQRYQREGTADRLHESLRRFIQWARFLEELPRRAPTAQEIATAERAAHTRDVFLALTAVHGELVDRYRAGTAPAGSPAYQETPWVKRGSGLGRLAVGAAFFGPIGTGQAPSSELVLHSAFLRERLGDLRANGLDPLAEVRLMDSRARWRLQAGLPSFEGLELDVVRVRSMPREPALMRTSLLQAVGYGAGASYLREADGTQAYLAHAEVALPLWASRDYEHHAVLGLGPALAASGGLFPEEGSAGGRVELSARGQLSHALPSALRLDASWTPLWRALGGPRTWGHEVRTELHLELAPSVAASAQLELQLNAAWRWSGASQERTFGAALAVGTP